MIKQSVDYSMPIGGMQASHYRMCDRVRGMVWSYGKRQSPLGLSLASAINYWLYHLEPGAKPLWASMNSSVKWVTFVGVTDVKCLYS